MKKEIILLALPFILSGSPQNLEEKIISAQKEHIQVQQESKKSYDEILEEIKIEQNNFKQKYLKSNNEEKKKIISEASNYVFDALTEKIFPEWYDTPWAFYGTTQKPNKKPAGHFYSDKNSIACGYFVTTTLEDAGFDISRVALAQQPSETMIKNLSQKNSIKKYSNKSAKFMKEEMKKYEKGIYIVGLDSHTGFIVNYGDSSKFVNSDYYPSKRRVVSENLDDYNPFAHSKYRVLGKIDDNMIKKWILGEKFPIKYSYKKN